MPYRYLQKHESFPTYYITAAPSGWHRRGEPKLRAGCRGREGPKRRRRVNIQRERTSSPQAPRHTPSPLTLLDTPSYIFLPSLSQSHTQLLLPTLLPILPLPFPLKATSQLCSSRLPSSLLFLFSSLAILQDATLFLSSSSRSTKATIFLLFSSCIILTCVPAMHYTCRLKVV